MAWQVCVHLPREGTPLIPRIALRALLGAVLAVGAAACAGDAPTGALAPEAPAMNSAGAVSLTYVSGDRQRGPAGKPLALPLVVRVTDGQGRPIASAVVNWVAVSGGGSVSARQTRTDAAGYASVRWTLGAAAGPQTVRASGTGGTYLFTATAAAPPPPPPPPGPPGAPATMHVIPDPMWLAIGDTARLRVVFLDVQGNVVPGPRPTFQSMSNYATVDADGLVRATRPGNGGIMVRAGHFGVFASVNPWSRSHERYGSPREAIFVVPEKFEMQQGDTARLNALWVDAEGRVSNARDATWSSLHSGMATVAPGGLVTARRAGGAVAIYARRGAAASRASIQLAPPGTPNDLVVSGLSVTPTTVQAGGHVDFIPHWRATGAPRLARFAVQIRMPDGQLVDGSWAASWGRMAVPRGLPPGRYEIVRVRVTGTNGGVAEATGARLAQLGTPTVVTVTP